MCREIIGKHEQVLERKEQSKMWLSLIWKIESFSKLYLHRSTTEDEDILNIFLQLWNISSIIYQRRSQFLSRKHCIFKCQSKTDFFWSRFILIGITTSVLPGSFVAISDLLKFPFLSSSCKPDGQSIIRTSALTF